MTKIALGVEYHGAPYQGWQIQREGVTLQAEFERALSFVANHPVNTVCAGRTDAGVHATAQVLHFETEAKRPVSAFICGTNTRLASGTKVVWAKEVDAGFHARFSALSRRYAYLIYNHPIRSALFDTLATYVPPRLNETLMHQAAQCLVGEHDFSAFRSRDCQSRSPFRHVFHVAVSRKADWVKMDIIANSFLHHMVRNIVGVLIDIGSERKPMTACHEILKAKDRRLAGTMAKPDGLYLTQVIYPDCYEIPPGRGSPLVDFD